MSLTEPEFRQVKEALREQKTRRITFYYKHEIASHFKLDRMTLWRIDKARTFNRYKQLARTR